MPWQKGYSQNGASSMLLHLITVSFPSRGSSEQWDNFYFFVFHFEQAGVSFMRSICSFTSFIQSIYGIAYGNMACSQSRHKTTLIIPRRENISVCVCVCVCVLKRHSSTTAGFSLCLCSASSYYQQTTVKSNCQQGLRSKLTPRQAPAHDSVSQKAVSWLWWPPRAAVSAWLIDQSRTRWFSQVKNNSDWKSFSHVWLFATPCSPWNSPGQNTGVGSLSLLQGIFPTQVFPTQVSCMQADSLPSEPWWKPRITVITKKEECPSWLPIVQSGSSGGAQRGAIGRWEVCQGKKAEWPLLEWQGNEKYLEAQAKLAKTCAGKNFLWNHHFVIIIKAWIAREKTCCAYGKKKLALQNEWLLLQFLQGQWII